MKRMFPRLADGGVREEADAVGVVALEPAEGRVDLAQGLVEAEGQDEGRHVRREGEEGLALRGLAALVVDGREARRPVGLDLRVPACLARQELHV